MEEKERIRINDSVEPSGKWRKKGKYMKRFYEWKKKMEENQRFTLLFKILLLIPLILWFAMFNLSKYIPDQVRPKINTETLPQLDDAILLGNTLLEWPRTELSPSPFRDFLDLFFAIAYLLHFAFAWVFAALLYVYYRNKKMSDFPIAEPWTFLFCFGVLNATAVFTQLVWPTSPPWYSDVYGEKPPNYSMGGNPAGLANADKLLSVQLFHRLYGQSPLVFGSFPSLHGAWPLMMMLFVPRMTLKIVFGFYGAWVWWAAMYLNHHYLVDLIGGALYVVISYSLGLYALNLWLNHPSWSQKIYNTSSKVGMVSKEIGMEMGLLKREE